jgi:hypothetical protein
VPAAAELVRVGRESRIGAVTGRLGFGRRGRGDQLDFAQVDRLPAGHRQQQCLARLVGRRAGGRDPLDAADVFGSIELSDADGLLASLRLPRAPCQACDSVSPRDALAPDWLLSAAAAVFVALPVAALLLGLLRELMKFERRTKIAADVL